MKPSNWEKARLKDVIQFNPIEKIQKGSIGKKIGMDKLQPFQRKVEGFERAMFTGGARFRNGDTLMARITPCLENGKTAQVNILDNDEIGFGSTEFVVMREKKGYSVSDFIYYLAISPRLRDIAIKSMTGTSGRQRAQINVIKNTMMEIPPIEEQKIIAYILSCFDDKINVITKINHHLEAIAQAIFKHWFVDFEFPNENGEPYKSSGGEMVESRFGLIPKGWTIASLDEIARFINGLAMQKYRPDDNENGLPVLKIRELRNGFTDNESDRCTHQLSNDHLIENGNIVFSWSGSLLVKIWGGGKCGLNQHLFKVESKKYAKWFYYYWTKHYLRKFDSIAKDKATTMGHIKRKDLTDSLVVIPTGQVYAKADALLSKLLDLQISLNCQSHYLVSIRDTLLPKLMSGEIWMPVEGS